MQMIDASGENKEEKPEEEVAVSAPMVGDPFTGGAQIIKKNLDELFY